MLRSRSVCSLSLRVGGVWGNARAVGSMSSQPQAGCRQRACDVFRLRWGLRRSRTLQLNCSCPASQQRHGAEGELLSSDQPRAGGRLRTPAGLSVGGTWVVGWEHAAFPSSPFPSAHFQGHWPAAGPGNFRNLHESGPFILSLLVCNSSA